MATILGLDPGTSRSAYFLYDSTSKNFLSFGKYENQTFLNMVEDLKADVFVYEAMQSYGKVGNTVFETCIWTGRFIQRWYDRGCGAPVKPIYRYQVKKNLCPKMKANDSTVRQALIDRFGVPGGKKNPGKTYGITADCWSALAIAVSYADIYLKESHV